MTATPNPKLAFSTLGCPDWTWREILERGSAAGFQGVEIRLIARETDLLAIPELRGAQLPQRKRELAESGLVVCGLASSVRFDETEHSARERQLETGRRYIELAHHLGASFVRVFGDILPENLTERVGALRWIADGFNGLAEYSSSAGVGVLLETHGDFCRSRDAAELMRQVASPSAGLLWDTHHPWRFHGESIEQTFARLKPWIRHTHWKDSVAVDATGPTTESADETRERLLASQQARQLMSGHRDANYVLLGDGEFPLDESLRLLRESEYDGWYSFEWERMWHPEIADPSIALPQFVRAFTEHWQQLDNGRSSAN